MHQSNFNTKKVYLTIDFEDLYFDYKRFTGIQLKNDFSKENILWNSYSEIQKLLLFENKKITFFCTGIIARQYPDLIRKISNDGHEIACHYFYHDEVSKSSVYNFEKNINLALNELSKNSKNKILGFRAPYFAISHENIEHFEVISKYFLYESSLSSKKINEIEKLKKKIKRKLYFLPIIEKNFYLLKFKFGGTYFKLMTKKIIDAHYEYSQKKNLYPILYFHPYEFDYNSSYFIKYKEFNQLKDWKKFYFYLKQFQWSSFNYKLKKNLSYMFKKYSFGNCLRDLILK